MLGSAPSSYPNGRKLRPPVVTDHGARLTEARFGHLQILVGYSDQLVRDEGAFYGATKRERG
jgi:hypothetical protein